MPAEWFKGGLGIHGLHSHSSKPGWKIGLRDALLAARVPTLPSGAAEVQLAWRCSPARNWAGLWKPTIDAMGPILGEPPASRRFEPNDGRITSLMLHRLADPRIGWTVDVGMWWRAGR